MSGRPVTASLRTPDGTVIACDVAGSGPPVRGARSLEAMVEREDNFLLGPLPEPARAELPARLRAAGPQPVSERVLGPVAANRGPRR